MTIHDRWIVVVSMLRNFVPLVGRTDSACRDNNTCEYAGAINGRECSASLTDNYPEKKSGEWSRR